MVIDPELNSEKQTASRQLVGPPGFEPESVTPEATRIPSYPTGPTFL